MEQELIERFREIVGAKYAITDQTLITPYLLEERGIFHGRTPYFYAHLHRKKSH